MLSNRPYLLRAFYQWIVDSQCNPILVIDANHPRCKIPQSYVEEGEIVFNISPPAIRDLKITNELIEFKASFSGVIHLICAPVQAILAIYAEENGEGIYFDGEDEDEDGTGSISIETSEPQVTTTEKSIKSKPFLRLVE